VSTARWNLKEAAGKTLARRTETAYKAAMPDEKANIFKVRYLYGRHERRCGGHKREGVCALPGEICLSALCYRGREAPGWMDRSQQRAYEIHRPDQRPEQVVRKGNSNFDDEKRRRTHG